MEDYFFGLVKLYMTYTVSTKKIEEPSDEVAIEQRHENFGAMYHRGLVEAHAYENSDLEPEKLMASLALVDLQQETITRLKQIITDWEECALYDPTMGGSMKNAVYGDDRVIRNVVEVSGKLCLVARGCRPEGVFRKNITHNQISEMHTVNCSLKKIAYACDGVTDTSCKHEARAGRPAIGNAMLDKITVASELKEALEAKSDELGISVADARREAYRLFTK